MVLQLEPDDIEIEVLQPGPIIHLFPHGNDPYKAAEEILQGLAMLKDIEELLADWETAIKKEEQPQYIIMAFAELQRVLADIKKHAEKNSLATMEKVKKV